MIWRDNFFARVDFTCAARRSPLGVGRGDCAHHCRVSRWGEMSNNDFATWADEQRDIDREDLAFVCASEAADAEMPRAVQLKLPFGALDREDSGDKPSNA